MSISATGTATSAHPARNQRNERLSPSPKSHASMHMTQSFATSLGWKNHSHRRPP